MEQQLTIVSPSSGELKFCGAFGGNAECRVQLILCNDSGPDKSEQVICFRLSSNNPLQFEISPPEGLIAPQTTFVIEIVLVARFNFDPAKAARQDRFLLQAVATAAPLAAVHVDLTDDGCSATSSYHHRRHRFDERGFLYSAWLNADPASVFKRTLTCSFDSRIFGTPSLNVVTARCRFAPLNRTPMCSTTHAEGEALAGDKPAGGNRQDSNGEPMKNSDLQLSEEKQSGESTGAAMHERCSDAQPSLFGLMITGGMFVLGIALGVLDNSWLACREPLDI